MAKPKWGTKYVGDVSGNGRAIRIGKAKRPTALPVPIKGGGAKRGADGKFRIGAGRTLGVDLASGPDSQVTLPAEQPREGGGSP